VRFDEDQPDDSPYFLGVRGLPAVRGMDPCSRQFCRPDLPQAEILHLPLSGPWSDVIEADFVDDDGRPYRLFVDCYLGTGVWQDPTTVDPARLRSASIQKD
jgi:hypothetical protein